MTAPHRHLTPGMRRARASAQEAIRRAQAHTPPPPATDPDDPWNGSWPPSPQAWRTRCRQIREEIEETRRHA
ncbi:hypothetical protein [Micromonospora sp. CB01531]|uniref:hypothetical protein n=1 Tax=Micromonospora sp. CB01531 TaxID=1718947 RepID=UPI000A49CB6C|nr:hypothetical protein [Micromonospora sp. CB01531]